MGVICQLCNLSMLEEVRRLGAASALKLDMAAEEANKLQVRRWCLCSDHCVYLSVLSCVFIP
jgi:hypothetical protein